MTFFENTLTRKKIYCFLALLLVFTFLTFLITFEGVDSGPKHAGRVVRATLGTIAGPLTGAIARDFQRCCTAFSLWVMVYCGPFLVLGLAAQFVKLRRTRVVETIRWTLWILGWLVWFMGGIFSFAHALS